MLQSNKEHEQYPSNKLSQLLDKVDKTPVTRKQTPLVQSRNLPSIKLGFIHSGTAISWVSSTLEANATRFLKRWSGLARSADPSHLYLPKNNGGLQLLPAIQKLRNSQAALLLISRDPVNSMLPQWRSRRNRLYKGQSSNPCG